MQSGGGRDFSLFLREGSGPVSFSAWVIGLIFRRIHHQQLWVNYAYRSRHVYPIR